MGLENSPLTLIGPTFLVLNTIWTGSCFPKGLNIEACYWLESQICMGCLQRHLCGT